MMYVSDVSSYSRWADVPHPSPEVSPTPAAAPDSPHGGTVPVYYEPSPMPGPTPTAPPSQPAAQPWTAEDENTVKALIQGALHRNGDNVEKAFAELRDRRQQPEHYYDTNLAIAADYLRARWETQKNGPSVAATQVETYIALKRTVGVPQEGPGPVSPYSDLQAKYMRAGVADEVRTMSVWEHVWWSSQPGQTAGFARAAFDTIFGKEEG
jgi:hypothetical protein